MQDASFSRPASPAPGADQAISYDGTMTKTAEVDHKVERVAGLAREAGLNGIVLAAQHNFAWLTAGRTNRVDATRETGSGALLVTSDGRRFALASTIESPRMREEAVAGLGFEVIEFPWTDERADATLPFRIAARLAGGGQLATDVTTGAAQNLEGRIARLRSTLVEEEIPRYRALGADVGASLGSAMRLLRPGASELDVARTVTAALLGIGAYPNVLLVAADRRIASYRHPVATATTWRQRLLVACCAEREGQIVAASRLIAAGPVDDDFRKRTHATGRVFGALLEATVAGATGAELFTAAAKAYAEQGYPDEELLHHQGGVIACRSREWVAHPASDAVVEPPQAFAWNPTVTGTKVEETVLLHEDNRLELVTASPDWPSFDVDVRGQRIPVPDVLSIRV
jgi:antitoxin VapB